MIPDIRRPSLVTKALCYGGFWTLLGISFAAQLYLSSTRFGMPITWSHALQWALADWYVWALLSLPIIRLARRFHFDRSHWPQRLIVHLAASVAFALLYMVLRAWVGQAQSWMASQPVTFAEAFSPLFLKSFQFNLLIYWVIVGISHAFDYYRKYQERVVRTSELEASLTQAKLETLQSQLNPHFLFNALHAISALVHQNPETADRMIARLSELLRYTLKSADLHEVPLKQELAFLEGYLEIEQTRFGRRLDVQRDIQLAALDAQVPNLLLQPLVENAVRHAVEPNGSRGLIHVSAHCQDEHLVLGVRDNGPGLRNSVPPDRTGVGLANLRARLTQLYPHSHSLLLKNQPEGGVAATVRIPLRYSQHR